MLKVAQVFCNLIIAFGLMACTTSNTKNISPSVKNIVGSEVSFTNTRGIEGEWEGLIIQGSALTYIKLVLSPEQSSSGLCSYTGNACSQSFIEYLRGNPIRNTSKTKMVNIQAKFDPMIRTFYLIARANRMNRRTLRSSFLNSLGGVYDLQNDVLVGLRQSGMRTRKCISNTGDQYFIFMRSGAFENMVKNFCRLDIKHGPHFFKPAQGFVRQLSSLLSKIVGPTKDTLRNWAQLLYDEYPGIDLYRMAHGHLELKAIKLFRDDYFEDYFGKPFDKLSTGELTNIKQALVNLGRNSRGVADRSTSVLSRMFYAGKGDNSAAKTTLWVNAQRHMLSWYQDQLGALASLENTKFSFSYTDAIEKEIEKVAETLLWPSEFVQTTQRLTSTRQRIAFPALNNMLERYKASPSSNELMNQLTSWRTTESRLFKYLTSDQSHALLDDADVLLNQILAELLLPHNQRIDNLGHGLTAVIAGNAWYAEFNLIFSAVKENKQVKSILEIFLRHRAVHLDQAQNEMLEVISQKYEALPKAFSKAADSDRLEYIASLKQWDKNWFKVPGDSSTLTVQAIRKKMAEYDCYVTGLLPPRLAKRTGFDYSSSSSVDGLYQHFFRSKVHSIIEKTGILAEDDGLVRQIMPEPIRDAGFIFKSNIVWALFHGRFDELDSRLYKGNGLGSDIASDYMGVNPRFHYAFITYIGLNSNKNGEHQIGPANQVYWIETKGKEVVRQGYGKVYMPISLFPYYERSYKLATKISSTDAIFGNNGLGFLQMLLDFREGQYFKRSGYRADGEFQFARAQWEKDIQNDLTQLLNVWPQQSYGLWQLQENIARYLKGRHSLQALYD